MTESRYTIIEVDRTTDPMIVFIEDLDGPRSVTNDAEEVIRRIQYAYGDYNARVIYKDTTGEWWEIIKTVQSWMGIGVGFKRWNGKAWDILNK